VSHGFCRFLSLGVVVLELLLELPAQNLERAGSIYAYPYLIATNFFHEHYDVAANAYRLTNLPC
jgi:hypothetical protein